MRKEAKRETKKQAIPALVELTEEQLDKVTGGAAKVITLQGPSSGSDATSGSSHSSGSGQVTNLITRF